MSPEARLLARVQRVAPSLLECGAFVSGAAAAHVHLAAATRSAADGTVGYVALVPGSVQVVCPDGAAERLASIGLECDSSRVALVVRRRLDLFATIAQWVDGTRVPVLSRDALLAQLLAQGGLAIGLAGLVVRLCRRPRLDPDVVREILKAAGQPDRFQPLHELLAVA